jgi:hypothetical protein
MKNSSARNVFTLAGETLRAGGGEHTFYASRGSDISRALPDAGLELILTPRHV